MKRLFWMGLALLLGAELGADPQGDRIARQYFDLKKAENTQATALMVLIDRSGAKKTRKLEIFTRRNAEGAMDTFIRFLEPADVTGTKFLTLNNRGESDQRLYLPALKKSRKIASGAKDGDFVNSDLSYYDMEDRSFGDNVYTFLAGGVALEDGAFAGMAFDKVEFRSKKSESPYARVVGYFNQADHFLYRLECYDKQGGGLMKTISMVKVERRAGVLTPTQTLVVNHKKGSKTLLQMENLKIDAGVSPEVFTLKNLEQ